MNEDPPHFFARPIRFTLCGNCIVVQGVIDVVSPLKSVAGIIFAFNSPINLASAQLSKLRYPTPFVVTVRAKLLSAVPLAQVVTKHGTFLADSAGKTNRIV